MECIGYLARSISTQKQDNQSIYVLQFALTVLAPLLVAAFCYILFGRITYYVIPRGELRSSWKLIWVPPRFVTPIFVFCDVLALLLQLVGALMLSSTDASDTNAQSKIDRGKNIALTGTVVQLVAFGLFAFVAVRFNFTSRRFENLVHDTNIGIDGLSNMQEEEQHRPKPRNPNWRALLRVVNITSGLILV